VAHSFLSVCSNLVINKYDSSTALQVLLAYVEKNFHIQHSIVKIQLQVFGCIRSAFKITAHICGQLFSTLLNFFSVAIGHVEYNIAFHYVCYFVFMLDFFACIWLAIHQSDS
jgi:hypothetical protein